MKYCNGCKTNKELTEFGKDSTNKDGFRSDCKSCRNKQRRLNRKNNKTKFLAYENSPKVKRQQRNSVLKREYKITLQDYEQMFSQQKGVCKICEKPEQHRNKENLAVDHCHKSGKVRGLLCHRCNVAIGLLKDNIELLNKTINYLRSNI